MNNKNETTKLNEVQNQLDEAKSIMVKNISSTLERGENLEIIMDKSELLRENSQSFNKNSKKLKRREQLKNLKIAVFSVGIFVVILIMLILIIYFSFKTNA